MIWSIFFWLFKFINIFFKSKFLVLFIEFQILLGNEFAAWCWRATIYNLGDVLVNNIFIMITLHHHIGLVKRIWIKNNTTLFFCILINYALRLSLNTHWLALYIIINTTLWNLRMTLYNLLSNFLAILIL